MNQPQTPKSEAPTWQWPHIVLEVPVAKIRWRLWEIIPGALSWTTIIGLGVLAFVVPYWIAIFIIAYDVYALIRVIYMSIHLVYAYRRLRFEQGIDWVARCRGVSGDLAAYLEKLRQELATRSPEPSPKALRQLQAHVRTIEQLRRERRTIYPWHRVHHLVVLPTYDESLVVLRASLRSLAAVDFPLARLHVVVGFEARAGQRARERARVLRAEFGARFGTFMTAFHPDGLPGETRVKSANATWAVQAMEAKLQAKRIDVADILVSNFDSDTVVDPAYFGCLTYAFITHPDRYHASYQPLPMYNNNIWDAPAFSRVIAAGSTFWQMIESTRPERLVTFSSHSMTLKALRDVGYWQKNIISEDSRIFWQCLVHYHGRYQTQPLYVTVSMDAALADNWRSTLVNQYKQKRRWAWGIENFPFLVEGLRRDRRIPRLVAWTYLFRTLEGHHSWATAPIIIAGLGWLPIFFGGPDFHATVLSYSLPFVTRTIMSVAMAGLLLSTALTILLLPTRPRQHSRWRYAAMTAQWALVPIIATVLSAFPALDAETRLLLGRDLQFNVMKKARREAPA